MRALLALAAVLAAAPPAAHDFWLEPQPFRVAPGGSAQVAVMVGDGPERQRSQLPARRIVRYAAVGPDGAPRGVAADGEVRFTAPGAHVLVLETDQGGRSHLPAAEFDAWLREAGLTPAIEARRGRPPAAGSESYGRRAKAIVQVGEGGPQAAVLTPLGLTLEITPLAGPAIAGADLPVRVDYEGRPLAGALVKLADLHTGTVMAERRTDAAGQAAFAIPAAGAWRLAVVWTRPQPATAETAFDTVFSSLTFEAR